MADLIDLEGVRVRRPRSPAADGRVVFDRRELRELLSCYSRRVMLGEWRDYAIDLSPRGAVFSVFRHTAELPLFSIVKLSGGRDRGRYLLASGRAILKRAHTLAEVVGSLESAPRLVWSRN
jgi:hypothetical protein